MQQWTMLSKAIRYQKAASDNIFTLISVMQNNSDKLLKNTLDRYTWLPDEGKKGCLFLANSCLQTTANMKAIIDTGYDGVNSLFDHSGTDDSSPGSSAAKSSAEAEPEKPKKPAAVAKKAAPKKKAASARKSPAKPAAKKTTAQKKSAPKVRAAAAPARTSKAATPEKAAQTKKPEIKATEATPEKEVKKEDSSNTQAQQK